MRKIMTRSMAATALGLFAAPVAAQAPWTAAGELTDGDRQNEQHRRYDEHRIPLQPGTRYRISVDSEAFDAVARLYRPGLGTPVAENDDGAGLNPRITFTPTQSGEHVLQVSAFSEEGRGAYTVRVAALPPLPPLPPAAPVPFSVAGRLDDGDGAGDDGDERYDQLPVRLEAGRRYRFSVDSSAFDPVASLYAPGGGEPVARNDDSGGGLNSRISFSPPESGDYVLRVAAFSADGRGDYRAAVELAPPLPPAVAAPGANVEASGSWSRWQGTLDASDPDLDGRRFDDYLIHVEPGRPRYISLEGNGFDTLIQVLRPASRDSDSPDIVDQDDDAGANLNSFLVFAPAEGGDYIVRVTSVGDAAGAYRLWISN